MGWRSARERCHGLRTSFADVGCSQSGETDAQQFYRMWHRECFQVSYFRRAFLRQIGSEVDVLRVVSSYTSWNTPPAMLVTRTEPGRPCPAWTMTGAVLL